MNTQKQQHEVYYLSSEEWYHLAGNWENLQETYKKAQQESISTGKMIIVRSDKHLLPLAIYLDGICYEPR